jgi:hypothetical protein
MKTCVALVVAMYVAYMLINLSNIILIYSRLRAIDDCTITGSKWNKVQDLVLFVSTRR